MFVPAVTELLVSVLGQLLMVVHVPEVKVLLVNPIFPFVLVATIPVPVKVPDPFSISIAFVVFWVLLRVNPLIDRPL